VHTGTTYDDARETLRDYGYISFFQESFESTAREGEVPARVVDEQRGRYRIARAGEGGGSIEEEAQAGGLLRREADSASQMPVVGDWVSAQPSASGTTIIRAVLPRRSAFIRKAPGDTAHDRIDAQAVAANVDSALSNAPRSSTQPTGPCAAPRRVASTRKEWPCSR